MPYLLKPVIDKELERLESAGIIEKVEYSDWGTPLVPIQKPDGGVRLCADYKVTLNKQLRDDKYPIPRIEELFTKLNGGRYFSTLDIHKAYMHLEMDEESSLLQTLSTHKGAYKVKRLMFGIKTAPNIWQRFMDQTLESIEGTCCFFDDIIVQGSTLEEAEQRLRSVLNKLKENGIHLNESKCKFFEETVKYLGYEINKSGLKKLDEKVKAILEAPRPTNVNELRKFLGLINYYAKFIEKSSSILHPLNLLLRKDFKWKWSREQEHAYKKVLEEISSDKVLIHYNPELPLTLATDASPYGISGVLSHRLPDGLERPIAFSSRSLTKSELNYSQLDKEATAIYWSLQKFYQYCYGRKFTLITDNRPLASILHPDKQLPVMTATRMLHYAQFISGFDYTIECRRTNEHANADYFSRFPLKTTESESQVDNYSLFQIQQVQFMDLVTGDSIADETKKDPELQNIYQRLMSQSNLQDTEYKHLEGQLTVQDGCILRGCRVVIPRSLHQNVLAELHSSHIGVVKMKSLARNYCWWKGIDNEIERYVSSCKNCADHRNEANKAPQHYWEYPSAPWERLHMDYAGPFAGTYFLIVVDAFSKWLEVIPTRSITSSQTIEQLRNMFSRFGLPLCVVSDNGTNFTSYEIKQFFMSNGVKQKFTAPSHPSTNGQAERYVQTTKLKLKKMMDEIGSLNVKLCRFLIQNRKTVNSSTGRSPAELMLGRPIRTRLDLMRVHNTREFCVPDKQSRFFNVGDKVQCRYYGNPTIKWKYGVVNKKLGDLHYEINIDGMTWKRHVDQMLKSSCEGNNPVQWHDGSVMMTHQEEDSKMSDFPVSPQHNSPQPKNDIQPPSACKSNEEPVLLRRSARISKPVVRLNL